MNRMATLLTALSITVGLAVTANAQLVDNGDGTITDSDLGIMWANNAALPGGSSLTYNQAVAWVTNLVFAGYDDWRLPAGEPHPDEDPTGHTNDGVYYHGCRGSEFGDLFYNELGGCSGWPIDKKCAGFWIEDNDDPDLALFENIPTPDTAPVIAHNYWTGMTEGSTQTWTFSWQQGSYKTQATNSTYRLRAWPVRDIDAEPDCFPSEYSTYADWVDYGKPECWCNPYQCDGDGDNATQGILKYRIYTADLDLLIPNWKLKMGQADPCADYDHKAQGILKYRVYTDDLQKLIDNWKKKDADLPGNCPRPE